MIALIHGFGTQIEQWKFRPALDKNRGFLGFEKDIQQQKAVVFAWGIPYNFKAIEAINPVSYVDAYNQEKKLTNEESFLKDFADFLQTNKPDTVVCHSMGAFLLWNAADKKLIPDCVKTIILVQADVDQAREFPEHEKQLIKEERRIWWNIYCQWDNALLGSLVINQKTPIGLTGAKTSLIKNMFYPLQKGMNFHEEILKEDRFRDLVYRLRKVRRIR